MRYFSTNRSSPHATFREALLLGQPADKGLFFPETIPAIDEGFWKSFPAGTREQIAFDVIKPFVGSDIGDEHLFNICAETVSFEFPLVPVADRISALELFHGPTLAFKDVGARFMSRCLQHFTRERNEKTIVLVATSGDTGGAVANGFQGVEGIEVVILYPKEKVSRIQELQLTTLGKNISAIQVEGTFDDCQTMAKTALADEELKKRVFLTSANSINIARWLPQQFYYFYAYQQWQSDIPNPVISVPSGNFGNVCAGILAHIRGLPCEKFIAACNANDVIPELLLTGQMKIKPAVQTLSNAMDVADPSNFVRVLEIFDHDFLNLKEKMEAVSVPDETTAATMRDVFERYGYVLDPHGAVGFYALEKYLENHPEQHGFFLETAHPVKFDSVEKIIGTFGDIPAAVKELSERNVEKIEIATDYKLLREFLFEMV